MVWDWFDRPRPARAPMPVREIKILHFDGINQTAAFAIALEGHLALIREGLSQPAQIVSWDDRAIVAMIGDEPAGVMNWREVKHWREVSLDLGYVRPAYRRRGVYRAMWNALVVKAAEVGARRIIASTHVDNAAMRATAAKLGRYEAAVSLWFDLPSPAHEETRP